MTQAILLAGGRGSRLGGVEKAELDISGSPLVAQWCRALVDRDVEVVVVGPPDLAPLLPAEVVLTREDPPFSGPASAVYAGLAALESRSASVRESSAAGSRVSGRGPEAVGEDYLAVLAVDIVDPPAVLDWLWSRLRISGRVVSLIPVDDEGRQQLACSVHAAGPLRDRAARLSAAEVAGASLRRILLSPPSGEGAGPGEGHQSPEGEYEAPARPVLPPHVGLDVDTPDDARRLGVSLPEPRAEGPRFRR